MTAQDTLIIVSINTIIRQAFADEPLLTMQMQSQQ